MNTAAKLKDAIDHFGDVTHTKQTLVSWQTFLLKKFLSLCLLPVVCPWTPFVMKVRKVKWNKSITDFSALNVDTELCHPDYVLADI